MDLEKQLKIATEENNVDALSKRALPEGAEHIASISYGIFGDARHGVLSQVDARKLRRIAVIALTHAAKLEGGA